MYPYSEQQLEQMIDDQLAYYTQGEINGLIQQAEMAGYHAGREEERAIGAFYAFLELIGLGAVASAIRVANWTGRQVRRFWNWLTG